MRSVFVRTNADIFADRGDAWDSFRCVWPATRREAEILEEQRKPQPPSRAHVKRLKRDRSRFDDPPRERPLSEHARQLRGQRENLKTVLAVLGGSRTIAPL
jgi:hypothetical protein